MTWSFYIGYIIVLLISDHWTVSRRHGTDEVDRLCIGKGAVYLNTICIISLWSIANRILKCCIQFFDVADVVFVDVSKNQLDFQLFVSCL